jgi:hypothetical protein
MLASFFLEFGIWNLEFYFLELNSSMLASRYYIMRGSFFEFKRVYVTFSPLQLKRFKRL